MKSESLADNQSMDSCETSIQSIPPSMPSTPSTTALMVDSMCQMNGNSPIIESSLEADPKVGTNSWTIETPVETT
ncbi:unnamed protein product, partial [Medioppia subpectinata]